MPQGRFTVAIIGRPNVGKSTLFNRLVGQRQALVDDRPGVTRDRREGVGQIGDLTFSVIDTAGLEEAEAESLEGRMRRQTDRAIASADVVLWLIDARAGITPMDAHFADRLRRIETPVILIANKCEGQAAQAGLAEAFGLGLGDPLPLSAEHGEGLGDLFEALILFEPNAEKTDCSVFTEETKEDGESEALDAGDEETAIGDSTPGPLHLAVVGRPNVGKSTLINRLLGEERLVTGPEAGLTRDSIAIDWHWQDRRIRLFDTAGMRRKARITEKLERLSVADSLRAIRFAQIVILLVDATTGIDRQDLAIARRVADEGRAMILALNKWDLVDQPQSRLRTVRERIEDSLPQIKGVPVIPVSGLTGARLSRLFKAALDIERIWSQRVTTAKLNLWMQEMEVMHPPPLIKGRRLRLRYITQTKSRPPTFTLFCSRRSALPDSYLRYLENGLRQAFGFDGVPIRFLLRSGPNPYAS